MVEDLTIGPLQMAALRALRTVAPIQYKGTPLEKVLAAFAAEAFEAKPDDDAMKATLERLHVKGWAEVLLVAGTGAQAWRITNAGLAQLANRYGDGNLRDF